MEGTKHLTPRYSQMALGLADDILGPILADGSKPDFISFGGGLPCPEGFPVEALREASDWCLKTYPSRSLQYSGPEGEPELREQIAAYETSRGNPTSPDEILVTSGSQQALDLCGRVFCDPKPNDINTEAIKDWSDKMKEVFGEYNEAAEEIFNQIGWEPGGKAN